MQVLGKVLMCLLFLCHNIYPSGPVHYPLPPSPLLFSSSALYSFKLCTPGTLHNHDIYHVTVFLPFIPYILQDNLYYIVLPNLPLIFSRHIFSFIACAGMCLPPSFLHASLYPLTYRSTEFTFRSSGILFIPVPRISLTSACISATSWTAF
jgi:hypothetical protein